MRTCLVVMAMTACLQASARPVCPIGDFYPATNPRTVLDSVADPKPEIVHDHEELWFELFQVSAHFEPGVPAIFQVSVIREDKGGFRVSLLRPGAVQDDDVPSPGVVDSRDLPAPVAERLHRGLIPILARTHYEAAMVNREARVLCMGGAPMFATVAGIDRGFDRLSGEAWTGGKERTDSDVGAVEALGQALQDYALRRIDVDGLEEPLELVEARAKPGKEPTSTSR